MQSRVLAFFFETYLQPRTHTTISAILIMMQFWNQAITFNDAHLQCNTYHIISYPVFFFALSLPFVTKLFSSFSYIHLYILSAISVRNCRIAFLYLYLMLYMAFSSFLLFFFLFQSDLDIGTALSGRSHRRTTSGRRL